MSTARRRTIRTGNQFPLGLINVIPVEIAVDKGLHKFTLQQQTIHSLRYRIHIIISEQIKTNALEFNKSSNLISVVEFTAIENQLGLFQRINGELHNTKRKT